MHGSMPAIAGEATNQSAGSGKESFGQVVEFPASAISASSGNDGFAWFGELARNLWPKKTAAVLQFLTGEPERSCYAFAGSEREPKASFLRDLLRSDQGDRVLDHLMRDCKQPWWQQRCLDRAQAAHARKFAAGLPVQGELPFPIPSERA